MMAERIGRLREAYNHWLADPGLKDVDMREYLQSQYGVSQTTAYSDLGVLHQLIPLFSVKSREFHRARYCEMILETYELAKRKEDLVTMERAASSYAKYTRIADDDAPTLPYDEIVVQPFTATTDPTPLGIKPIPNYYAYVSKLTKELSADCIDIEDVECEEADLDEATLFAPLTNDNPE